MAKTSKSSKPSESVAGKSKGVGAAGKGAGSAAGGASASGKAAGSSKSVPAKPAAKPAKASKPKPESAEPKKVSAKEKVGAKVARAGDADEVRPGGKPARGATSGAAAKPASGSGKSGAAGVKSGKVGSGGGGEVNGGGAASKPAGKAARVPEPDPVADPEIGLEADVEAPEAVEPAAAGAGDARKKPSKGITIANKPAKTSKAKQVVKLPQSEPLLKPGGKWKPLIPSGPGAPPLGGLSLRDGEEAAKTPYTKKELERFRQILIRKRHELAGDIATMEDEALRQSSGALSHTPQHMAEQGTDMFDQSLSLDLAQVDRNLIREIDAALKRIDDGTYGVCEHTGKPIKPERLEELPWTRYSIEAARERERRPYMA